MRALVLSAAGLCAALACRGQEDLAPPAIDGDIVLETRSVSRGEEVFVSGSKWSDVVRVIFYLLTEDEYEQRSSLLTYDREAIRLKEITAQGGAVSLRVRLEKIYRRPDGREVHVEPGQKLYVLARQATRSGAHASTVGPLTVLP